MSPPSALSFCHRISNFIKRITIVTMDMTGGNTCNKTEKMNDISEYHINFVWFRLPSMKSNATHWFVHSTQPLPSRSATYLAGPNAEQLSGGRPVHSTSYAHCCAIRSRWHCRT